MTARQLALLVFVAANLVCLPGRAVIVFQKNSEEPLRGILVREDTISIEVHELLPSGEIRKHILPRVSIDDMLRAVDPERLAGLDPAEPESYRSYAEDLAVKTEDPEARVFAIRLYLIAAYLKPHELGRSCLLGMASLARTPEEERAFRAMAFSLDADHDPALLKAPRFASAELVGLKEADRRALKNALQALRNGRTIEARRHFARPTVQETLVYYTHLVTPLDLQEALRAEGRLPTDLLRKFLTVELALSSSSVSQVVDEASDFTPWSRIIARNDVTPIKPQSLLTITEFDPRQSLYRDGQWIAPEA